MMLQKKRKQDFTTMKERQKPCSSTLSPGKDRRYCISSEMKLIGQHTFDFFFHDFYMTYDALDLFFTFFPTKKDKRESGQMRNSKHVRRGARGSPAILLIHPEV